MSAAEPKGSMKIWKSQARNGRRSALEIARKARRGADEYSGLG
jgi:hypothetical protein